MASVSAWSYALNHCSDADPLSLPFVTVMVPASVTMAFEKQSAGKHAEKQQAASLAGVLLGAWASAN